ncbi:DUF7010 family protein [Pontixanthobacter sp.]|uniref:DUF7010 family protein n=1 Tax=Pontixanthobacter sp. TaxID=2792078 RepID=UPI003C7A8767
MAKDTVRTKTPMNTLSLAELQTDFREGGTVAMPIAGMIVWAVLGAAALQVDERTIATGALYIMMAIMPLAFIIDKLRGRNLFGGGTDNPLTRLFLLSILIVGLVVPIAIAGANAGEPLILVVGMAVLAGIVWIPYGWAADDPVGVRHAVVRSVGCYTVFALVPAPYTATAICAVVVAAYVYSLIFMRR